MRLQIQIGCWATVAPAAGPCTLHSADAGQRRRWCTAAQRVRSAALPWPGAWRADRGESALQARRAKRNATRAWASPGALPRAIGLARPPPLTVAVCWPVRVSRSREPSPLGRAGTPPNQPERCPCAPRAWADPLSGRLHTSLSLRRSLPSSSSRA